MIDIKIKTNGEKISDSMKVEDSTLSEASAIVYRLEQLKLDLLSREFESDFEVQEE